MYDPAYSLDRGAVPAPSPTSTATPASCATAATRSSSWPRSRRILEVAYLLLNGELPDRRRSSAQWTHDVTHHTFIHENMRKRFMDGFHYDAHPMGMLVSAVAALSTFYNDAKDIFDPESRDKQILRLIAKMPTLRAVLPPLQRRPAVRLPDNTLTLPGQLPQR